jgi:hypothetical protein
VEVVQEEFQEAIEVQLEQTQLRLALLHLAADTAAATQQFHNPTVGLAARAEV